jgi:hypothetical protein
MALSNFLGRKPKPVAEQAPVTTPPDDWFEPAEPREQTKVAMVRAAKVGRVPGARRQTRR